MISFRYHVVSIVAVFLALAVGVVLGSGPLQRDADAELTRQAERDRAARVELQRRVEALETAAAFTDTFEERTAPALLSQRLQGRPVSLVVLPGAEESAVTRLTELVQTAGGAVSSTVRVSPRVLDAGEKQLVEELGNQLEAEAPGLGIPSDAGGYLRMGRLLGRAVAGTEPTGAAADEVGNSILAGLTAAELVSTDAPVDRRSSLVVVVAGEPTGSADDRLGAATIGTSLALGLDQASNGVVVAGPLLSAEDGGIVAALREDVTARQSVSSVDVLDRAAGAVVTVLALAEQATGGAGQYGALDPSGGALPGGNG